MSELHGLTLCRVPCSGHSTAGATRPQPWPCDDVRDDSRRTHPMSDDATNVFLTFPPRSLADGEREMVRQWFAGTTDIASAYVSERRGDDPTHFRKIVIVEAGSRRPAWLVHCPNGTEVWLVTPQAEGFGPRYHTTLRAALEWIRPAQPAASGANRPDWAGTGAIADRR